MNNYELYYSTFENELNRYFDNTPKRTGYLNDLNEISSSIAETLNVSTLAVKEVSGRIYLGSVLVQ